MNVYNYAIVLPIVIFLLVSEVVAVYWLGNPIGRDEFFSTHRKIGIAVGVGAFLCTTIVVMLGMAEMIGWVANSSAEWWLEESESMSGPSGLAYTLGFFASIGLVQVYHNVARVMGKAKRMEYVESRVREMLRDAAGQTPAQRDAFLEHIADAMRKLHNP
jgi:hypothetical protein